MENMRKRVKAVVIGALILSIMALSACGDGRDGPHVPRTLHFDLDHEGFLNPNEEYWLHVDGERMKLRPHSDDSLKDYTDNGGSSIYRPTHYVTARLPEDRAVMMHITQRSDHGGSIEAAHGKQATHGLALPIIHIPPNARMKAVQAVQPALSQEQQQQITDYCARDFSGAITEALLQTYNHCDVAKTILFHHPELMNFDADTAAIIMQHVENAEGFYIFARKIQDLGQNGWYTLEPVLNEDGSQYINSQGEPVSKYLIKQEVLQAAELVLQNALVDTKNDPALEGISYNVIDGTTSIDQSETDNPPEMVLESEISASGTNFTISHAGPQPGLETKITEIVDQQLTVEFRNNYIRHLGAYIEFYDIDDQALTLTDWGSRLGFLVEEDRERLETDTTKFLTLINPPSTVMSIPVLSDIERVTFTMPAEAAYAKIYAGGLGHGGVRNRVIEELGVAFTSTFELGIPGLLLATTVPLKDMGSALKKLYTTSAILSGIVKFYFAYFGGDSGLTDHEKQAKLITFAADLMVQKFWQNEADWFFEEMSKSVVEDAIPFSGWILAATSIVNTASLLAQTAAEVSSSPWIIDNRLNASHDMRVTIHPDPRDGEFPATATHYKVWAQFSRHDTRVIEHDMPGTSVSDPIQVAFADVPTGGKVNVIAAFYSDTGWEAGHGQADGAVNRTPDGKEFLDIPITITESLVPLSVNSFYSHKQKLEFDGTGHKWVASAPPDKTIADLDTSEAGSALSQLVDISINQKTNALGYAWRSFSSSVTDCVNTVTTGQLYTFQVISAQHPESGLKFSGCGTQKKPYILLDLLGATDGSGQHFAIVPGDDGFFHARKFVLDSTGNFNLDTARSYGRFPDSLDSVVVHPKGLLLGINRATSKIYSLTLSEKGAVADSDAPEASLYSGPARSLAGARGNPNLLINPVAVALGLGGELIILESIGHVTSDTSQEGYQGRLRAFSEFGRPMKYFNGAYEVLLKEETDPVVYLDVGIESKGYIYVLSHINDGYYVDDYRLDIYNPKSGSFLVRTAGVAAAKMAVDLWRNVYTLNFESFVGPGGRTEPSVSEWVPATP